jgi:hypothetical protein
MRRARNSAPSNANTEIAIDISVKRSMGGTPEGLRVRVPSPLHTKKRISGSLL